jgi:hypothetical protein
MIFQISALWMVTILKVLAPTALPRHWIATSKTAMSITGDVTFTATSVAFSAGGGAMAITFLRDVPASVSFLGRSETTLHAYLYRVSSPDLKLRAGNTLCGARPTYATILRSGTDIILTIYSGASAPTGAKTDRLCAGYAYEATGS